MNKLWATMTREEQDQLLANTREAAVRQLSRVNGDNDRWKYRGPEKYGIRKFFGLSIMDYYPGLTSLPHKGVLLLRHVRGWTLRWDAARAYTLIKIDGKWRWFSDVTPDATFYKIALEKATINNNQWEAFCQDTAHDNHIPTREEYEAAMKNHFEYKDEGRTM